MRYQGGKAKIAKLIAAQIAPRGLWLEPFCGGMNMSAQFAQYHHGVISDVHPALISYAKALCAGWIPPEHLTRAEYESAKTLDDSNPLKGYAGFCFSFAGRYFASYAEITPGSFEHGVAYRAALKLQKAITGRVAIARCSFFDYAPNPSVETLYCDPPYAGTAGYLGTPKFDHAAFWDRCREWATGGTRVFVSEYAAPDDAICVWEKTYAHTMGTHGAKKNTTEKLFRVPAP